MEFQQALEANAVPRRVGDVRLRYFDGLLIGEARRRQDLLWVLTFALAAGCASFCVIALWPDTAPTPLPVIIGFAAAAALFLALSIYLEQRSRGRRRFVLNFAAETIRFDLPSRVRGAPTTTVVPFGQVRDLEVAPSEGGFQLLARVEGQTFVLVDRAQPSEVDSLRRLWRAVRAAVGLQLPLG